MSFTEFTYQLVQGYDFYWLYANKKLQASDGRQRSVGHITTGTELVRRKGWRRSICFTCPLITKADGGNSARRKRAISGLDPSPDLSLPVLSVLA